MKDNNQTKIKAFIPDIAINLSDGNLIDLLFYDQASQKFSPNQEALEIILDSTGNVGLVFNFGHSSIGKSFTLNHVLDLPASGNCLTERTKGIKIWTKPLYRDTENLYLFFVDVQGFSSDDFFKDFVWLFAFLLGTTIIYSTSGQLDDDIWNDFSSFDFISKTLILSENPVENDYLISYYSPKLIWLMKDTNIPTNSDGRPISADKYLENSIYSNSQYDINFFKNFFVNSFKDRCPVVFPPVSANINFRDPILKMTSQYIENIKIIKEKIYSKAVNKFFDGIPLSSRMMIHFISYVTEVLNKKSVVNYYEL